MTGHRKFYPCYSIGFLPKEQEKPPSEGSAHRDPHPAFCTGLLPTLTENPAQSRTGAFISTTPQLPLHRAQGYAQALWDIFFFASTELRNLPMKPSSSLKRWVVGCGPYFPGMTITFELEVVTQNRWCNHSADFKHCSLDELLMINCPPNYYFKHLCSSDNRVMLVKPAIRKRCIRKRCRWTEVLSSSFPLASGWQELHLTPKSKFKQLPISR